MTMILAVDPGGTSGWALSTLEEPIRDLQVGQDTPLEMAARLREFCATAMDFKVGPRLLVMERFVINAFTAKKTAQPDALELIGLGRYLAEWHGVTFELQAPEAAKNFAKDQQLRKWGAWVPKQDHARDAVRHLLYACARRGIFLIE